MLTWIYSPELEQAPRDELRALQRARLRGALRRASTAPEASSTLRTADLDAFDSLTDLPLTTKEDLRRSQPFGRCPVAPEKLRRIQGSSGSSGAPTLVGYTEGDLEVWALVVARTLAAAGARAGDRIQIALGYGMFTGAFGFHAGAERLGVAVIPSGGGGSRRQLQLLAALRPGLVALIPSYALRLAEVAAAEGVALASLGVGALMLGAEPWSEAARARIEAAWGARAVDTYGLSELGGPGVAFECEARAGLHINEDHFLPEILAPDAEGRGELVLTALTREALPLIRYRTGDLTRLDERPCDCGRTLVRMERVAGRLDDLLIVRGVNVFPSQIERAILSVAGAGPEHRIRVDRRGVLAELDVIVEADPALRSAIRREIEAGAGIRVTVSTVPRGALPRGEGKAQRVEILEA